MKICIGAVALLLFVLAGCGKDKAEVVTCEKVGAHMVQVTTSELGVPMTSKWEESARLFAKRCTDEKYSDDTMKCVMNANSAEQEDRCLGQ